MDTQELNKKLAEWAGWKYLEWEADVKDEIHDEPQRMKMPPWIDPEYEMPHWSPPWFTSSLDACFKWLVPNDKVSIVGVAFRYYPGGTEAIVTIQDEAGFTEYKGWVKNEEPKEYAYEESALALCLAIEKLIDGE